MPCQIIFSTRAAKDLQETFEWYENLEPGLGVRFIDFVDRVLGIIELYPESFPRKKNEFREASIRKFPYLIIYEYSPGDHTIFVLHIFHSHKRPKRKYSRKR